MNERILYRENDIYCCCFQCLVIVYGEERGGRDKAERKTSIHSPTHSYVILSLQYDDDVEIDTHKNLPPI